MGVLKGKTALISGAGRGIGQATAVLFADEGADLILVARTAEQLDSTKLECEKKGARVITKTIDLADPEQIDRLFDELKSNFTQIDILINNAAMFDSGEINNYTVGNLQQMLSVNLFAAMLLAQNCIKLMDRQAGGTIVNVSSLSGCFGVEKFPGFGAYNISKYGLWGLTEILALENKENNIRINQIAPGGVDTEMFRRAVPPGVEPSQTPVDVAKKILFLASNQSGTMTGENIMMTD